MLTRRFLLGGVALGALGGCGLIRPGDDRRPLPAPSDPPLPGQDAVVALRAALVDAATADLTAAQADLLGWAIDVNDDQFVAVSLPAPSTRPTPSLGAVSASPAPTGSDAVTGLVAALGTASEAFGRQALDEAVARPLVWAAVSAWAAAVASQLPEPTGAREPERGVRLPAPQEPTEAAQAALDAATQTLYGLQIAAGTPGLPTQEVTRFARRLSFWSGLRDDIDDHLVGASATPSPGAPWYDIARPADPAAARALAARLQATAMPVLGRTLAHGPGVLREPLTHALADIAADVPRWGGLLERWPGLPTT